MPALRHFAQVLLAAGALLCAVPAMALPVGDVARIAAQGQLDMPLPVDNVYDIRTLKVSSVGVFRDGDGSQWLRVEGSVAEDEDAWTVLIDSADGQVEMGLVINRLELADLGSSIGQLRAMAKAGEGKLSYEGKTFSFSGAARSQFTAGPGSAPVKLAYFILQCDEDNNLSLMVLNWGDHAEVLLNERIDPSQVSLRLSGQ